MPNTKSAKKRLRQNEGRRARNRAAKSELRTHIRNVRDALKNGDVQASEASFRGAVKSLDQSAAKRVIHPNRAARIKSRLSAAIKKLKAGAQQ